MYVRDLRDFPTVYTKNIEVIQGKMGMFDI